MDTPQPIESAQAPGLTSSAVLAMLQEAAGGWIDDNVPRLSASLTFYTLLSLTPLLVIVIAIAAFIYGRDAATGQLMWSIRGMVGTDGAAEIQHLIQAASKTSTGTVATVISLLTMLLGASTVVLDLQEALNFIWKVPAPPPVPPVRRILAVVKERFYAFGLIIGAGLLLLVSLLLNAGIAAAGKVLGSRLPASEFVLHLEAFLASLVVITILFAAIYKIMPAVDLKWSDVLIGAAFTALVFVIGKQLIAIYIGKVSIGSPYGAASSLVVVLVWIYYSAQLFFMGAEFTKVYAKRRGSFKYRRIVST